LSREAATIDESGVYTGDEVVDRRYDNTAVTEKISNLVLRRDIPLGWLLTVAITFTVVGILGISIFWLLYVGTGIWGLNVPVGWGLAILNFVWWIGIGHAGTLISAILHLMRQDWRNSINRFAEAMTIFAVMCAGMFPLLHVGRPWLAYWLLPLPNTMALWPQWRSPLLWDVFAVSTYFTVSLIFWYMGMIPDLGTLRDRAQHPIVKKIFGFFALGWRGAASHWARYEKAYLILAGLSTPLVLSVHSIVSFDFAVSLIPGWHTTVFPPYFVAGAIYAGFAMVLTLTIPVRKFFGLEGLITTRHLENMGKVTLATGFIVVYGYAMEAFISWYSASPYEGFMMLNRMTGPYAPLYWLLIFCNAVSIQVLWSKRMRRNPVVLFIISLIVGVGMWLERFIIVITSLSRDYMPSSWDMYYPTIWDWGLYIGTLGFFLFMMCLFIRFLPIIPMSEMKLILPKAKKEEAGR
jgi:molybdopterin-containing oxidoreductase family membrane subunit